MTDYQRPWWLLVNKSTGLISTVQEEGEPGRRVLIVRGEPLIQGLAWLTWGPVSALLVVLLLAVLAIMFKAEEQSTVMRALFIVAFLGLPAVAWIGTVIVSTRLSDKYLRAERQAERQECIIQLDQNRGQLSYQATGQHQETIVAFEDIHQVRAAHAIGGTDGASVRLVLDTDRGVVVLLNESLGTQAQKVDLAREIQAAIDLYTVPDK